MRKSEVSLIKNTISEFQEALNGNIDSNTRIDLEVRIDALNWVLNSFVGGD